MRRCLLALMLLPSAFGKEFLGLPGLERFSREVNGTLLVYFNNENNFRLLSHGSSIPLNIDAHLWTPESCCAHRATPSLSRDSARLAFVQLKSTRPRREAVTILNVTGGSREEVFAAAMVWGISWSPGGERLAVVADQAGERGHKVYIVESAKGAVLHLKSEGTETYSISDYAAPSWSPDGNKVALELRQLGPGANNSTAGAIAVWRLQSGTLQVIAKGVDPSWSRTSDEIAFFDPLRKHCYSIHSDGSQRKLLFSSTTGMFAIGGRAPLLFPVAWSADSGKLIFHEWVDADLVTDVYELDFGTGKRKRLTRSEMQVVNWN
jgi:WD40 repeat protein